MKQYIEFVKERFRHETEWYGYYYIESSSRVCICHKTLTPALCRFYTKEELEKLIKDATPYSLPVYQEALKYFPQ